MHFNIISSGSKGNATIVVSNKTVILIDMGIPFKRLEEGCQEIGLTPNDINYALFTHNHSDHIGGLKFLSPKIMYALENTLPTSLSNVIEIYKTYQFGDFKVTPIKTSHDAKNPCGFMLEDASEKMVYITDTGIFVKENLPLISNPTYLVIESNHDISMLMKTNRPEQLKQRILSDHGHLCNEDSAFAALSIIGDNTKNIYLAHLSEEANTPEMALKAYKDVFSHEGVDINKYKIVCAHQHHSTFGGDGYED